MAFDVAGAKGAGYSDDEISDFLAANPDAAGFDAAGAQRAGYSPSEIVGFLTSQKTAGDGIIASAMNALTDAGKAVPAEFGRLGVSAGELGRSLVGAAAGRLNQVGVLSDSANDAIDRSIVDAFQRDQRAETASPSYQAQTTLGQVAQSLAHMAPAIAASLVAPEVALPAFAAQGGWDAGKGAIDSGSSLANAQLKAGSQAVLNSILGEYIGRAGNALLPKIPVIGGAFVPAAADTLRQVVARSAQGAATMAAFKPAGTLLDWAADQFTGESAGKKYEPMPTAADLLTGALMAVPHAAMEFANRNALPVAPTVFADGSAALAHKNGSLFSSADAANAFIDANAIDDASVIPVTSKTFDASAGNDKVLGYAVKPPASPTEATSDNAQPPTLTPDQLTNGAQARLAELDRKAVGTENTVAMHDGKPVAIPGEQPQILSDAEQAERNFLASNLHDPDLLARGYGVNLDKTQAINAQSLDVTDDAAVARHADAQQLRIGADLNDLPGQPVDTEAGARSTGFGERDINYERNRLGQETGAHAVDGESIDAMPKGSSDETETPVESKPAGASDADRDGDAALADAQRQRQEARTVAERMAAAERLAQVHRDIAARQEAGAENLRLGKNPEDGWSGQGGIVDGPIASRQGMSKYPRTTNAPSMAKPLRPTSRALPEDATTNIVDSPQIRKSISEDRPSAGLSVSGASNILHAKFGKGFLNLRDSGILKIVQSFNDLPAGARAGMDGSEGGVYWKGTGYLIADNQSRSQIVRDVIHEIGEHHGLQRMMGDDAYAKLLRDVAVMKRTGNRLVSEIWAAVKRSYDYPEGSEAFMKEVVAKLGETAAGRATSLWSRITIAIKLFLNKMGLRNFNARDVADLVAASLRKTMNGAARGKPSETQAASSRPAPESAKSAPREAIRKALRIMATPEWQTYRNTRDPTDRGDLKDAEEFIRDPSNAESDRALYAEILLDRVHDESRRAVGVSPQAMLDDMDFTPSEGVVSWVDPASLGNESSAKKGGMISREHARAIQWLGQRLDTEVHFFRQEWTSAGVEGITSADYPDTIFINAVSGSVGWQYLVGHEFLHRMPDDLKNEFIKSIKKEVTPENYRRAKHYVNQPTLPEHKQWEEIAADLMGNRFGESAFWDRVLARISDPSLMQKLLDYLKNFLAKLRQISRPPYETDHFVRNVDRMRDEAVRILRSHIDRKCAARGLSNAVEDDGPRASRISPSDDIRAQSLADSGNADRRSDAARSEPPEHPPDTTMTGRRSAGPSNPEKATLSGGLSVSGAGDAVFADKQDDGSKRGNGNDSASVEPNDSVWRSAQEAALAYCAKVPGAKIEFVEIGGNIVSWLLNAAGEPLSSWGVLTAYAVEAKRTSAEKSMQREVAKDDQGDDGGHLVAFSFVGNQGLRNMFSQAKNFNRSAYLAMENDFRRYIDDGNRVVFNHVLGDFDANGRPGSVAIEFRVTGEEGRQVDRFKQVFRNEPGQIYMRRHWTK